MLVYNSAQSMSIFKFSTFHSYNYVCAQSLTSTDLLLLLAAAA
jgi:hypothetical protein